MSITSSPPATPSSTAARGHTGTAPTIRTTAVVSIAALVVVGQLYAVLPLVGSLSRAFATTPAAAAWTSTAFGFAYAAGMLVAGSLSDALGRRRVAAAGLLAAAIATALVTVAPSFALLLVARVIQGAAAAFFPPVALAYLTERVAPHRRSAALTTMISSFLAAAILAPLASSALSGLAGWRTWFYVSAAALVILAAVVRRVMLPDSRTPGSRAGSVVANQLAGLPAMLRHGRLATLYLTCLTVMMTFVGVTALIQLAGPGTAGHPAVMQIVRAATLPACLLVPLAAPLLARVSATRRLVAGLFLVSLAVAATAAAGGPVTLAIALGVVTAAVAAAAPALVEAISRQSPPQQRGAATALYGFTLFVGASIGAPAAAIDLPFTAKAIGFAVLAAVGGLCAFLATRRSSAE